MIVELCDVILVVNFVFCARTWLRHIWIVTGASLLVKNWFFYETFGVVIPEILAVRFFAHKKDVPGWRTTLGNLDTNSCTI